MSDAGLLAGHAAFVTGASRGIGAAIAAAYAGEGAHVLLVGRDRDALELQCAAIRLTGGSCRACVADMARDEDVERACAELLEWKGRCDILVANAGAAGTRVPLVEWSRAEWDAAFELNVRGTFVLIQSLDAALRKSPAGRAVFLTTAAVRKLPPGAGAYAVSKAALEAMVRLYAKETQGGSLTVTLVDPGPTRTAMRAGAYPREDPDAVKPAEALAPLFLQLAVEGKPGGGELVVADDWLAARVPAGN